MLESELHNEQIGLGTDVTSIMAKVWKRMQKQKYAQLGNNKPNIGKHMDKKFSTSFKSTQQKKTLEYTNVVKVLKKS